MAGSGRILFFVAVWAIVLPVVGLQAAEDQSDPPLLRIPGLPPIPMPPGTHVHGPDGGAPGVDAPRADVPDNDLYHEFGTVTPGGGAGGHPGATGDGRNYGSRSGADMYGGMVVGPGGASRPMADPRKRAAAPHKAPPTPEEKQAQIRKALAPKPPLAAVRRQTLVDLYGKLAQAKDEDESKGLASLIAAIWMRSGSDTADLLVGRADKAVADKNYPLSLEVLDRVVELKPEWPEAWNKRASVRYLAGDLDGAMSDVDHVLKLDPNHFAALNGLATILQRTGFDKRALQVYRRELAIYPHQPELEKVVEKLTLAVEGQGI